MYTMMDTNKLVGSQFNPPDRIDPKNLKDLVDSMNNSGFWTWMPIITGKDGRVADGHRRLAAASLIGLEKVPVEQVNLDTAVIWANINLMHQKMRAKDIAYTYQHGAREAIDNLPKLQTTKTLKSILKIGGESLLRKVVETNTSPNIIIRAKWVANYCGESTDEFITKTANWLMDNEMSATVNFYIRNNLGAVKLFKAISDNRPIVLIPTVAE